MRGLRAIGSLTLASALVFAHPAWAMGPLEKNHPLIEAGTEAFEAGRYEDALAAFESAKQQLPDNPAVDFNLGNALHKLGRHDEAKEAWLRATNAKDKELRQKAWYNLGNGYAAQQQRKEAISAYRRALTLDPNDGMARHNLEVLLRDMPPKKDGQDGGTDGGSDGGSDGGQQPDAGRQDGGTDGGSDGGADGGTQDGGASDGGSSDGGGLDGGSDGGTRDGGPGDGGSPDAGLDGGQSGGDGGSTDGGADGGQSDNESGRDGGSDAGVDGGMSESELHEEGDGGEPANLSEQDAEKLLDSMKQNEKNLQLWRFQQRKKQRGTHEKDW